MVGRVPRCSDDFSAGSDGPRSIGELRGSDRFVLGGRRGILGETDFSDDSAWTLHRRAQKGAFLAALGTEAGRSVKQRFNTTCAIRDGD